MNYEMLEDKLQWLAEEKRRLVACFLEARGWTNTSVHEAHDCRWAWRKETAEGILIVDVDRALRIEEGEDCFETKEND